MILDNYTHPNLSGIPSDYLPVTPNDYEDNVGAACIGLYVEDAGKANCRLINTPGAAPVQSVKASAALLATDGSNDAVPALRLYYKDTATRWTGEADYARGKC